MSTEAVTGDCKVQRERERESKTKQPWGTSQSVSNLGELPKNGPEGWIMQKVFQSQKGPGSLDR
jgi:hypothetical protein